MFLLRFGELTLKSPPVRKRMVQRMINNLKDALRRHGCEAEIQRSWARVLISTEQPEEVSALLSRLFGLRSFSPILKLRYDGLDDLLDRAEQHFGPLVSGQRFEVRARREKQLPLSTREIEQTLGARLHARGGIVDLTHPTFTCSIELRGPDAYLFAEKIPGPGGLPLGTELPALALLSGGFDSPVAAWHVMRRGVPCDFLFFELGGIAQRGTIYAHVEQLYQRWAYGYKPRLTIVPGAPLLEALRAHIPQKFWNVMLKRIFYRVGEALALEKGHVALVTGEAIAQVSSQTLSNLRAIEHGITLPLLRPVLTAEKNEIIQTSRDIGTHDISAHVQEYCAITPKHPATRSRPEQIEAWEAALGGASFYQQLLDLAEHLQADQITSAQLQDLSAIIDRIPADAIWIDMREESGPPLPQPALPLTLEQLLENPDVLDPQKTYLLLCDVGMISAEAAFMLQEQGYKAFSFEGGIQKLQKHLSAAPAALQVTTVQPNSQTLSSPSEPAK